MIKPNNGVLVTFDFYGTCRPKYNYVARAVDYKPTRRVLSVTSNERFSKFKGTHC